jgi:alpha-D-ribose 1-methylphosphonate 5-triphosphate diphosphatase
VSFEDHTPGQGQYRDAAYFRRWLEGNEGITAEAAQERLDKLVEERDAFVWHRPVALAWLAKQASSGAIRLLAHDPVTPEEIDAAVASNVSIAEFPTTVEAARAAKQRGLFVVAGAPNVLRGGSHSGNVSALELISLGLVDALSSDYLPTTLLAAAVWLADRGGLSLPAAVELVTAGAARTAGLADRGALVPGLRGDLAVATVDRGWPTVRLVRHAHEDLGILVAP